MIYKLMAEAIQKIDAVGKTQKNLQQGYAFRGIEAAMAAANKVMSEVGLCLTVNYELLQNDIVPAGDKSFSKVCVRGNYEIFAPDGKSIKCSTIGLAYDYSDKAANKAMSFALKYFLFQTFLIPTEYIDEEEKDNIEHPAENEKVTKLREMPENIREGMKILGYKAMPAIALCESRSWNVDKIKEAIDKLISQQEKRQAK